MDHRDFSSLLSRKCKRKEIRKTSKQVKKASKVAFSKHQKVATAVEAQLSDKKAKKRAKRKRQAEKRQQKLFEQEEEPQELEEFLREAAEVRRQRMREELDNDDAEIRRLEKKLKNQKEKRSQAITSIDEDDHGQMPAEEFFDEDDAGFGFDDVDEMSSDIREENVVEEDSALEEECETSDEQEAFSEGEFNRALEQSSDEKGTDSMQFPTIEVMNFNPALLSLARKAKMGSGIRQNVFCTIMSSEEDTAFERLKNLRLDGPQEREIIRVCVECSLLESQYNQFYSVLISKFCCSHARFQVTTQYVLWDLIKGLQSLKNHQQINLAHLVADLFNFQAIGLSVLRIVDFSNISPPASVLLKWTFYYFFTSSRDSVVRGVFLRVISCAKKKNRFSEGLQLFFEQPVAELVPHFNDDQKQSKEPENIEIFKKRLALVKRLWSVI